MVGQESAVSSLEGMIKTGRIDRTFLIAGPFGSGKCVIDSTRIPTTQGFLQIGDLVDTSLPEGFNPKQIELDTRIGAKKTKNVFHETTNNTLEIITNLGYSLEGTFEHSVLCMTKNGIDFKRLDELEVGDYVAINRRKGIWAQDPCPLNFNFQKSENDHSSITYKVPSFMNEDLAWICGALVANGCLTNGTVYCTGNKDLLNEYVDRFTKVFGVSPTTSQDANEVYYACLSSVFIIAFLESCGLKYTKAADKEVPWSIFRSPEAVVLSFLRGYSYNDSGLNKKYICFCSASEKFIEQLHLMLLNLGIVGCQTRKTGWARNGAQIPREYSGIQLDGINTDLFLEIFPNWPKRKNLEQGKRNTNVDIVPYVSDWIDTVKVQVGQDNSGSVFFNGKRQIIGLTLPNRGQGCTYSKLADNPKVVDNIEKVGKKDVADRLRLILLENFYWDTITATRRINERKMVYDFEVSLDNPTFIGNGFVNHNTTFARLIARYLNCTKPVNYEPCNECRSCQLSAKDAHPDVMEVNAANARGIEDVRQLIEASSLSPQTNYRIFILDEAHQLTPQSAQALLKPLEEPAPKSIWIICTTDPNKLPRTIISRCTKLNVQQVAPEETSKLLKKVAIAENCDYFSPETLLSIAKAVHGHPRDALSVLESAINIVLSQKKTDLDISQMVSQIVEEVVQQDPNELARKFLLGVYQGKFTMALMAIQGIQNHGQFIETVIEHHKHMLFGTVSQKLKALYGQYHIDWYLILEQKGLLKPDETFDPVLLSDLMQVFVSTLSQAKAYLVDPSILLLEMTTRAVGMIKSKSSVFVSKPKQEAVS
jgi:DNA polymerase III subunit gamma/tau